MKRRLFTKLLALGAGAASFPFVGMAEGREDATGERTDHGNAAGGAGAERADQTTDGSANPVNIADLARAAQANLPKATFDYITTGSEDEITLRENVEAFRRLRVVPPLLKGVGETDLSTTVLDERISLPILLAPVAAQRMYHPQGALAAARAAAAAGTIFGVSSSAGNSVEEIAAAATGPKWYQLYVPKDRRVARQVVQRVEKAGYKAIIVTVDLGERKDSDRRNDFKLPKEMLVKHLRDVGFDQINHSMSYEEILQFNATAWDLALDWNFFQWLRSITELPLLIKGVLSPADALKAVELGLDGVVVSNHGGRRLDSMPATIDVLPSIVNAVDGRAEILLDSGVRRGTDVLKALALGAKAVLIGRPYAWGLAAGGEAGVKLAIDMLRDEFRNALLTCGCASVADVDKSLIHLSHRG